MPGTPRIVPIAHHGVRGREQHQVGVADRLDDAGCRRAAVQADEDQVRARGRRRAAGSSTPGSAAPRGRWGSRGRRPRRGSRPGRRTSAAGVTPGCQRRHSASVTAESGKPASSIWVRTRWVATSRSPRPNQVGSTPYAARSVLDAPGLLAPAPAALEVDAVAEGVHHGVEVGADLQAVHPDVVGGVGHDGDLRVGGDAGQGAGARCRGAGPGGSVRRPCRRTAP